MPLINNGLPKILKKLHAIGLTKPEIESPVISDEPKFPNYICMPVVDYKYAFCHGQGFDTSDKKARVKAVAECLERICIFNPEKSLFAYHCFGNKANFVDPSIFASQSNTCQNNLEKNIGRENLSWWSAIDFLNKTQVFIPAQMLFLSRDFNEEFPIRKERISTGTAFGMIGNRRALYSGFFEVIERDAIMGAYLMKKNVSRIMDLPKEIKQIIDYYNRYKLETHIFDITSDLGIPAVMAVVLDRTGIGEAVNLGAKSGETYLECIKSAVFEAIQPRRAGRLAYILHPEKMTYDYSAGIKDMEERYAYWHPVERIDDIDFWINSSKEVDYKKLARINFSFEKSIELIRHRGYSVFVSDITRPEIKKCGFETMKVLIPELHPLYLAENAKELYSVHYGKIPDDPKLKPHPFT